MKSILTLLALATLILHAPAYAQFLTRNSTRVLTNAWASPEFEARRNSPDGPPRLTYHFYQGEFHGGLINNKSLAEINIQKIVEILSKDMEAQNFYPADSLREGDMMIVIHWGTTAVQEKWEDLFPEDSQDSGSEIDEDGIETSSNATRASDLETLNQPSIAQNARLTGIDKALKDKSLMPSDRSEYRQLLEEERYFIILAAYDWQALQKEKQRQLLWSCRFSLPSIGTNFVNAVPSLSRAAAPYFGTNLEKIHKTKTHLGWGKTKIGQLEVVEEIKDEKKAPAKSEE